MQQQMISAVLSKNKARNVQVSVTEKGARSQKERRKILTAVNTRYPVRSLFYGIACISYIIASYWRLSGVTETHFFAPFILINSFKGKGLHIALHWRLDT
jgi:hypothetical protein